MVMNEESEMAGKRILLLLGGTYHDFEGFANAIGAVFRESGCQIEATYDPNRLVHLEEQSIDVVVLYTCLGGTEEDGKRGEDLDVVQTESLVRWVRAGGGLLAAHAATVVGDANPELPRLIGGKFVSHPPPFVFTVYPMFREHPLTAGIRAFSVYDELYVEQYDETAEIQMVAVDRGICHPMVWSRAEGKGAVVHIALGHGPEVWELQAYQRLMVQAVEWLGS